MMRLSEVEVSSKCEDNALLKGIANRHDHPPDGLNRSLESGHTLHDDPEELLPGFIVLKSFLAERLQLLLEGVNSAIKVRHLQLSQTRSALEILPSEESRKNQWP